MFLSSDCRVRPKKSTINAFFKETKFILYTQYFARTLLPNERDICCENGLKQMPCSEGYWSSTVELLYAKSLAKKISSERFWSKNVSFAL